MVIAVVAVFTILVLPVTSRMNTYAARVKSISNLRQIGVAARLYANEHDQQFPGQPSLLDPVASAPDQWPKLFCAYLSPSDPRVFLDPADARSAGLPLDQIVSNTANNTGYVYNGFDDLAAGGPPLASIPLTRIEHPVEVILIAQKSQGSLAFYVDLLLQPLSQLVSLLNPAAYDGGSHYLFADGSVRYLKQEEYSNSLWLVNKAQVLPGL